MTQTRSQEIVKEHPTAGLPMLLLAILVAPIGTATLFILAGVADGQGNDAMFATCLIGGFVSILVGILLYLTLVLINPNHARVVLLFGRYQGSILKNGFFALNPFTVCRDVSLRIRNFTSETLKVNDSRGNPVEIAAVVVWRVKNTAQALFDVEDFEDYVKTQTESGLRHLAACHPYDLTGEDEEGVSLRGSADIVSDELERELAERLQLAGIEVLEVRLAHLAYSAEIAGAMLQRQQADAIIAARTRIVDGAVGMVRMALDNLKEHDVVDLDEERKAAMVSNLLTVLCSERGTTPVVNTGTLHN
ncbi:MAG: SPFH domain-containing protein [Planctomycetota bacterium]|jgi:regulator of protease activity HflC (stomatin/prohibitin superfamily)